MIDMSVYPWNLPNVSVSASGSHLDAEDPHNGPRVEYHADMEGCSARR